jgi:DNA segregation ATPase FtsK/SpoIIIE, S-DNA-T family
MDVRICLRVRERRDTDLILGQGMVAAGWHAHILDAPGKFLVTAEDHDQPRRARAYLVADEDVQAAVDRYSSGRPALDAPSSEVLDHYADDEIVDAEPEALLWAALQGAPESGLTVLGLMQVAGMRRTWIY